ncbi:MAG: tRNA (adenosine(37)-N6)-dimethylallyltransferase MiaA [Streptococcaceae bacterium]|nr:tRNA (adenosine(37)-N6)-dimethylallyltransferase MiaA [Streptococcaceae bacterium]
MKQNKVLVVLGPTAVGKTALGLELARAFDGEIISGDSLQVYKTLDIGTAKATAAEQRAIVHHLIDVRAVPETYSVHDFVHEATAAIWDILARGKVPIIVGGTGLYVQALTDGFHLGGNEDHAAVLAYRKTLSALTDEQLRALTDDLDISEWNVRRAIRALEHAKFGGQLANARSPFDFCLIGLTADRALLYERINTRVDAMMGQGLMAEAQQLYDNYPNAQAAQGIGYKELFAYFDGLIDLMPAVEKIKQNTRHYAKRQLTWFKNRMPVTFFDSFNPDTDAQIMTYAKEFLHDTHSNKLD